MIRGGARPPEWGMRRFCTKLPGIPPDAIALQSCLRADPLPDTLPHTGRGSRPSREMPG